MIWLTLEHKFENIYGSYCMIWFTLDDKFVDEYDVLTRQLRAMFTYSSTNFCFEVSEITQ